MTDGPFTEWRGSEYDKPVPIPTTIVGVEEAEMYDAILREMTASMESHPWWKKRVEGTPLENDLPVRAANIASAHIQKRDRAAGGPRLLAERDEARALLKELEWCIPNAFDVPTSCPVCWGSKNTGGHAPDCRLAAAIKETTHAK